MGRRQKPLIYVFWEGESEQAYSDFLKSHFIDVAVIRVFSSSGLFDKADSAMENDRKCKLDIDVIDEIWFFFDTEDQLVGHWEENLKIIRHLRRLNRSKICVRLLMTSRCIEYWLLLHFHKIAPSLVTIADKDRMLDKVIQCISGYRKGHLPATHTLADHLQTACANGSWTLQRLEASGLPTLEESDLRNEWLYRCDCTFTTVHEAVQFLTGLRTPPRQIPPAPPGPGSSGSHARPR